MPARARRRPSAYPPLTEPWQSVPNRNPARTYRDRTPYERRISKLDEVGDWDFDGLDHDPPQLNGLVWASSITHCPHEFGSCEGEGAYALAWALEHPRKDVREKIEKYEAKAESRQTAAERRFQRRVRRVGWHQAVWEQHLWELRYS